MMVLLQTVLLLTTLAFSFANENDVKWNVIESVHYLEKYGYFVKKNNNGTSDVLLQLNQQNLNESNAEYQHALTLFQQYAGLPTSGRLDNATLDKIRKRRCGNMDNPLHMEEDLIKWENKTTLYWNFITTENRAVQAARNAFDMWENHSSLNFVQRSNNYDILISFKRHVHYFGHPPYVTCLSSFDGPHGVLAHAYFPNTPREVVEIHVDQDEPWNYTSSLLYLQMVLTHEIGHALGISHISEYESIMYPWYNPQTTKLSSTDIRELQARYGEKVTTTPSTTTTSTTTTKTTRTSTTTTTTTMKTKETNKKKLKPPPNLCEINSKLHTFLIINDKLYIFYKKWVWVKKLNEREFNSQPELISNWVNFLPNNFKKIDAIYQKPNGDLVAYINNIIYVIDYPSFQLIKSFAINMETTIAVSTYRGRIFTFTTNYCVELDPCNSFNRKSNNLIADVFPGIPSNLDGVFRYNNGHLYFFKQKKYYEFDEFSNNLISAGNFDVSLFNINCPNIGILEQLRNLLEKLYVYNNNHNNNDDDNDNDYDDE